MPIGRSFEKASMMPKTEKPGLVEQEVSVKQVEAAIEAGENKQVQIDAKIANQAAEVNITPKETTITFESLNSEKPQENTDDGIEITEK